MNKEPFFSVVVPCYNAEKYLRECLDSCLSQTFHEFEIICVDDASTDTTQQIVEEYKQKDSRIYGITLEKNTGSAKLPRETGVFRAKGKFICAIDADDWIAPNYLQQVFERIQATGADGIVTRIKFVQNKACALGGGG